MPFRNKFTTNLDKHPIMIVPGWNNGYPDNRTGTGYGIKISTEDRDRYFHKDWNFVEIELENGEIVRVNLSNSFWNRCAELRSSEIGKLMLDKVMHHGSRAIRPNSG